MQYIMHASLQLQVMKVDYSHVQHACATNKRIPLCLSFFEKGVGLEEDPFSIACVANQSLFSRVLLDDLTSE